MPATVLLLHEMPDSTWHFDWMLQLAGCDATIRALATFRVSERIDRAAGSFVAERIGDHRVAYLTFEGELSDSRGHVRRVAQGHCVVQASGTERLVVDVMWEGSSTLTYEGWLTRENWWHFEVRNQHVSFHLSVPPSR